MWPTGQAAWRVGQSQDTAGWAKDFIRLKLEHRTGYILLIEVWCLLGKGKLLYSTVSEGYLHCCGGKKKTEAVHWTNKLMKRAGWECAHCLIWFGVPNGLKQPIEFLCLNQIPAKETFYDALIGSLGFLEQGTLTASYVFSITGITRVLLCFGFCFVFHIDLPWQFPHSGLYWRYHLEPMNFMKYVAGTHGEMHKGNILMTVGKALIPFQDCTHVFEMRVWQFWKGWALWLSLARAHVTDIMSSIRGPT